MAANPNFNQLNTDFSKPNTGVTGASMANRLGLQYDLDTIRQIFTDAANSKSGVTKQTYEDAIKKFYEIIAANQALQQQALSKTEAESVVNNASAGVAAANKLLAILGGSQQATEGAQELALKQLLVGDQLGADMAQAERDALTNYNDMGSMLGQLINEMNAVQAQAYAAELAAQMQREAMAGGAGGGYGGYSYGGSGGAATGTQPKATSGRGENGYATIVPEEFRNAGRFTQAIMENLMKQGQVTNDEYENAILLGRHADFADANGYENPYFVKALQEKEKTNPGFTNDLYAIHAPALVDANTNFKKADAAGPAQRVNNIDPHSVQARFPSEVIYSSNIAIPKDFWKNQRLSDMAKEYQAVNSTKAGTQNTVSKSFTNMKTDDKYLPSNWSESQKNLFKQTYGKDKMVNANGTVVKASDEKAQASRDAKLDWAVNNYDLYKKTGGVANAYNQEFLQEPTGATLDIFGGVQNVANLFTGSKDDKKKKVSSPMAKNIAQVAKMFLQPEQYSKAAQAVVTAPLRSNTSTGGQKSMGPATYAPTTSLVTPTAPVSTARPSSSSGGSSWGYTPNKPVVTIPTPTKPNNPPSVGSIFNPNTGQVVKPKPGQNTSGLGQLDKWGNILF